MQSIWFPAWLYRFLPLIYLVCGALMFYLFGDEIIGRLSGFLLFAAAILIWGLRLHARRDASRRRS
jgi:positive regulator of sigma E activity